MKKKLPSKMQVLKQLGINAFMAVKCRYNECVDKNDFYAMLGRRLQYEKSDNLSISLINQLHIHWKEHAQYK